MLKKILNNPTLMSWAANIVRFGSAFLITPLIIVVYSDMEQSFYWFLWTIIGFAMLADAGFGSALVRAVSYFKAGEDYLPKNKEEYDKKKEFEGKEANIEKLTDLESTTNKVYFFLAILSVLLVFAGILFI